jgi:hypothetical protein
MNKPEFPRHDELLPDGAAEPAMKPPIVAWYKAYCVLMALIFLVGAAAGVALVFLHPQLPPEALGKMSGAEVTLRGIVLTVFCVLMFSANVAALFLPRRPWAWIYHLINISLGLAPCCIFSLPLFFVWLQPSIQKYFGYTPPSQ